MSSQSSETISHRLSQMIAETSLRSSQLHLHFLQQRGRSLRQIQGLIEMQLGAHPQRAGLATARPALYDSRQLDEFGVGKISNCFGPSFAHYVTRRIPRIPNGSLKMMSRVVDIWGNLKDLSQPAGVEVEYDAAVDAWYLQESASVELPYFLMMEMALQPCGFLSAYLDTYALVPHGDFYFRNLDGHAHVAERVDVRGKTLTTRAQLLNSVASGGTVIQKFGFAVCDGSQTLYEGESTFGYFSAETMAAQVGLDGGQKVPVWLHFYPDAAFETLDLAAWRNSGSLQPGLPVHRLGLLDKVTLSSSGGHFGKGYLHAYRPVNPQDWFYPFHFIGDPVMPGSLGVEAILEMMKAYALALSLGSGLHRPRFSQPAGDAATSWRYRGQITPQNQMMELEVHIKAVESREAVRIVSGDASVWVDGLRIYEVKNISIHMVDG